MKSKKETIAGSSPNELEKELAKITLELERKNRDLEIEASLERVRTVAMGMSNPDDLLNICETMFHELKKLGFADLRNTMIDIYYEPKEYLLNYDYSENTGKTITTFKYNSHPIVDNLIYHAKQSNDVFTEMVYSGKALDELRVFRKENGEADDARLDNVEALYYYFYAIGTGAIGISTFSAANLEQLDVLKRFRNVFDLAYKRYIDITNAEAQAREAQIELGLERVRARAMAMQSSDELAHLVTTLFNELAKLHITFTRCMIWLMDNDALSATVWMADPVADKAFSSRMQFLDLAYHTAFISAWKERKQQWAYELKGAEKQVLNDLVFSMPGTANTPEEVKAAMIAAERVTLSFSFSNFGGLQVDGDGPLSEDNSDILSRFSKVFDQTYTRFSDLKKAEAQAREALIEGALERVRSRAMAMHKTDELLEAAELLPKELTGLGIGSITVCYVLVNEKDKTGAYYGVNPIDGKIKSQPTIMPHTETKVMRAMWSSWLKQEPVCFIALDPEASLVHQTYIGKLMAATFAAHGIAPEFTVEGFLSVSPERIHVYSLNFKQGYLFLVGGAPLAAADIDILIRFTKVFELTYTRFLDIKKAEEQAREGRIELALERVRARTMAMQHSDELAETAYILFQQFRELGENPDQATIGIINEAEGVIEYWVTLYGSQANRVFKFPIDEPNVTNKIYKAWKAHHKSLVIDLSGESLHDFSKFRESMGGAGYNPEEKRRIINVAFFSKGLINVQSTVERSVESLRLLERFANVFEGTYTRFLDLKNAEAQAREAQIELALERVRAKTMAMQHSDDLAEAAAILFQQVKDLGIKAWLTGFEIWEADGSSLTDWVTGPTGSFLPSYKIPLNSYWVFTQLTAAKQRGEEFHEIRLNAKQNRETYTYLSNLPDAKAMGVFDSGLVSGIEFPELQVNNYVFFLQGSLLFITYEPCPEAHDIFKRFGKVFEQTYTRFLDLQKAEEQAREAKIEAALERVRSRTMGMQHSDELQGAALLLFQQAEALGVNAFACGFNIWDDDRKFATSWMGSVLGLLPPFKTDSSKNVYLSIYEAAQRGETLFVGEQGGEELKVHYDYLATIPVFRDIILKGGMNAGISSPTFQVMHCAFFAHGYLMFVSFEPCPEAYDIFKRFAKVFEQTYTRFLDLQKAETQTREAQIEAALERVRSRIMGMRHSDELREVIKVMYEQLVRLNFEISTAGFLMDYRQSDDFDVWVTDAYMKYPIKLHVPYFDNAMYNSLKEAKEKGLDFNTLDLTFEEKNEWVDHILKYTHGMPEETKAALYRSPGLAMSRVLMKNVALFLSNFAAIPYSDADNAILMRFGKVFEQTYTRFNDLQKAEAQAREAVKQASLDRVRGEIASMRTTKDLERIIPLVWNELTILGIPFIRCGVFIVDEDAELIHTHLSTPDGKAIAAFDLPFDAEGIARDVLPAWRKKQMAAVHWSAKEYAANTKNLVSQGAVKSRGKYVKERPNTTLDLHFFPFLQGMLYAGNTMPLTDDDKDLVQSLADAFSTAYARYEDFNRLEAAKQQVDKTLTDLKAAQTQLIQTEKMASLGELTAGIAHEIQNPLNFVNNFSEVNTELIEEMKEEIEKGDLDEILALALDIEENSKKINMHGKRADGIVKGMLQHSQSGSGTKEPTNINAIADEYMRLAYHGLRAKDKLFNAEMAAHFDPELPKIKAIGQDIGRVLLNLFNNAFYAVNKKQKTAGAGYKPEITVATSSDNGQVVIKVKDNGTGMPEAIREKIMQPFFTTKPTGEGTGLGLSLTYDMVVKGHGGSIQVESIEGEGSEFIITLPIS